MGLVPKAADLAEATHYRKMKGFEYHLQNIKRGPVASFLWSRWDSNPLPFDCEPNALPDELLPLVLSKKGRIRDPLFGGVYRSRTDDLLHAMQAL